MHKPTSTGFTPLPPSQTLPTGVRFRGRPNTRWREFEDASVDLGSVDAGPSDIARLALLEFGLVYANDFFAVPLRLPVGSLCRITSLVVADTFGMRLQIGPAGHGPDRQGASRWSMFTLSERQPPEVRLRLKQMADRDATATPRGRFLVIGSPAIPDAGVPREGTSLVRDYALIRWANGATFVWARRVRTVGRGEGSSGLRFDVAEYTEP